MSSSQISSVHGRRVWDSRGRPTVEVEVTSKRLRRTMDKMLDEWGDVLTAGELPPFEEFSKLRAALAAARSRRRRERVRCRPCGANSGTACARASSPTAISRHSARQPSHSAT